MSDDWLIVKRDLYFRPDRQGYTGIRDLAGRYSYEEANGYADHGCSMVKLSDAPEFSKACYPDMAAGHMQKQRDALAKKLDDALGVIHDLLGLELGSSERAMKFLDDNSPTAADVRGILDPVGGAPK